MFIIWEAGRDLRGVSVSVDVFSQIVLASRDAESAVDGNGTIEGAKKTGWNPELSAIHGTVTSDITVHCISYCPLCFYASHSV